VRARHHAGELEALVKSTNDAQVEEGPPSRANDGEPVHRCLDGVAHVFALWLFEVD
jgi:hypothetical protein